mgnify:FL=1
MIQNNKKSTFPSQSVTDSEKSSLEYGTQVANAIESEWFKKDAATAKYL